MWTSKPPTRSFWLKEWKLEVHVPGASPLWPWGLAEAGAGRLPVSPGFRPPQLPPLSRRYFGERQNSQWGKKKKTNQRKERGIIIIHLILKPVGRGGKRGRVVQSCDSQAALLPCRAKRAQSCSISADSLGSSGAAGLPCFPHPLILLCSPFQPGVSHPWRGHREWDQPVPPHGVCPLLQWDWGTGIVSLERGAQCWVALLGTLLLGTWSAELSSLAAASICLCLCCQSS